MISSRNCTLQQSSVNRRDQCVHRECHCIKSWLSTLSLGAVVSSHMSAICHDRNVWSACTHLHHTHRSRRMLPWTLFFKPSQRCKSDGISQTFIAVDNQYSLHYIQRGHAQYTGVQFSKSSLMCANNCHNWLIQQHAIQTSKRAVTKWSTNSHCLFKKRVRLSAVAQVHS